MNLPIANYQARRQRLQAELPEGFVAIVRTGELSARNSDCDYEFRPNSHFYYLTGYAEPSAYVLINKTQSILFNLAKDPEKELWDGFRHGTQGAIDNFGFDKAYSLEEMDEQVISLLDGCQSVWFDFSDELLQKQVMDWQQNLAKKVRQGAKAPAQLNQLAGVLGEMRLIKDTQEIELMEKAAQISVKAHTLAMQNVSPGMLEYELEAELNYCFMKSGSRTPAYNNIVATGSNACTLHYIENNAQIQDGDLILIDAGCELGFYASDITRTFPANGRFSAPQAALYNLVLKSQKEAIEAVVVGAKYTDFHDVAVRVLTQGLVELGLLQGDLDSLIADKAYRDFYMHNTGHWIGLDVHDVGAYKLADESRPLLPGMVVTVEPGLYVAKDNMQVDEKWRGIGIRIEDDVLVTESGPVILTHGLAREIDDIEALMASK